LPKNGHLLVRLPSNPSAGYSWVLSGDPSPLILVTTDYQRGSQRTGMAGAPQSTAITIQGERLWNRVFTAYIPQAVGEGGSVGQDFQRNRARGVIGFQPASRKETFNGWKLKRKFRITTTRRNCDASTISGKSSLRTAQGHA
jgi:hypothetical protein